MVVRERLDTLRQRPRVQKWLRYSRARALTTGVVLLAVPTAFTVVPAWTTWHGLIRAGILALWLGLAIGAVGAAVLRDETLGALASVRQSSMSQLRQIGLYGALREVLRKGSRGIPPHYELTLYWHDTDSERLLVYYPPSPTPGEDVRDFAVGCGATGTVWQNPAEVVVVSGDAVANAAYGLTPEQQALWKDHRAVAASVVWRQGVQKIGVLTAISKTDDRFFSGIGGQDSLRALAEVVGVILDRIPEPDDLGLVSDPLEMMSS